ncbi:MAG TPA: peptide deformylase, partial [Candidatus Paceibacterota bacterium]
LLAKEKHGVGLAAPQIGAPLRLFIIAGRVFEAEEHEDGHETKKKTPPPPDRVFINPTIIRVSKSQSRMSEGCLSVRGLYGAVIRHDKATVKALDENGKPFTLNGSGLLAQIFQHEVDHLEGTLYTDKAIFVEPERSAD